MSEFVYIRKYCSVILHIAPPSAQDPSAMPRPTSQDLAGFWDLLQLTIDDVTAKFDELQQIKSNQWQLVESPEKKVKPAAARIIIIIIIMIGLHGAPDETCCTTLTDSVSVPAPARDQREANRSYRDAAGTGRRHQR